MTMYHAVLMDETGCEFGADCHARSRDEAYDRIRESYPESRIVQLESPEDTREREARIYLQACRDNGDDDFEDYDYDEDYLAENCLN